MSSDCDEFSCFRARLRLQQQRSPLAPQSTARIATRAMSTMPMITTTPATASPLRVEPPLPESPVDDGVVEAADELVAMDWDRDDDCAGESSWISGLVVSVEPPSSTRW